jgi:hypothetical protein
LQFSALREEKQEREDNTTDFCFVCSIEKLRFQRLDTTGEGFQRHVDRDHNMWSYMKFLIFLWEQDKDDDDGLELYVVVVVVKQCHRESHC